MSSSENVKNWVTAIAIVVRGVWALIEFGIKSPEREILTRIIHQTQRSLPNIGQTAVINLATQARKLASGWC